MRYIINRFKASLPLFHNEDDVQSAKEILEILAKYDEKKEDDEIENTSAPTLTPEEAEIREKLRVINESIEEHKKLKLETQKRQTPVLSKSKKTRIDFPLVNTDLVRGLTMRY